MYLHGKKICAYDSETAWFKHELFRILTLVCKHRFLNRIVTKNLSSVSYLFVSITDKLNNTNTGGFVSKWIHIE